MSAIAVNLEPTAAEKRVARTVPESEARGYSIDRRDGGSARGDHANPVIDIGRLRWALPTTLTPLIVIT